MADESGLVLERHDAPPPLNLLPGRASFLLTLVLLAGCGGRTKDGQITVRAGHFPNVTHAQVLVGRATGGFAKVLELKGARLEWKTFNGGPSAIEALFAGEIDLTYVGPNPAINGYFRSRGEALRIVAGACSGGAALVVRADAPIKEPADFNGRSLATPQLGNTQDVAARSWILQNGMDWTERGGRVRILPLANPDQLTLFQKKEIDAAWTVEPWVTRLIEEGGGRLFLDEADLWPGRRYVTTHLVASTGFLRGHPGLVRAWVEEQARLTEWIIAHRDDAARVLNEEIKAETGRALPESILRAALARLELTDDPVRESLVISADRAFGLGFLGDTKPDLSGIYDLSILNEVLMAAGKPTLP